MIKTRKKFKTVATAALISGLALGGTVANGVVTAEPAQALGFVTLEVFYSPNCTNASRTYYTSTSTMRTEAWINDIYNGYGSEGKPGFAQKIRYNAASIRLSAKTNVLIRSVNPVKNQGYITGSQPGCFNLQGHDQRNKNIQFTLWARP